MTSRRAHPAVTFFGDAHFEIIQFVCAVSQFILSLSVLSIGLSIHRSLFSSFSFPFPSILPLLLLSSGNRTAKLIPIPFCSRDLPESYLLLFFSLTFFLHPCGVQPFEILREIAVNIYRVLRVDSPTHYRFDIRIFRSVKSNVNKPAPCSTICHLACKCRIAGSCHQDARSVQ
jgi:hypothetical protein